MGWDLSIHRYESMAHAEECLASLGQDTALWSAVDKLRGQMEIEEITKFTNSVSYGTEERLEAALNAEPDSPRQYLLAVLQTSTGGLLPAIDTIGTLVDTLEGAGAMQLATAYASRIGRTGELTDLWIMPNGPDFMMQYQPGDALADVIGPLREHAPGGGDLLPESVAVLEVAVGRWGRPPLSLRDISPRRSGGRVGVLGHHSLDDLVGEFDAHVEVSMVMCSSLPWKPAASSGLRRTGMKP